MKKPSARLTIDSNQLLAARNVWRNDMRQQNVPYVEQQMFDIQMHVALATVERLDALIELLEHFVVDHVCAKEHKAHDVGGSDKKDIDELLDGLGPRKEGE